MQLGEALSAWNFVEYISEALRTASGEWSTSATTDFQIES